MRELLRFAPLLCLLALSTACRKDPPYARLSVNGGEHFLSLDAQPRSGTITVQAPASWVVDTDSGDDWFTLSEKSGPAGYSRVGITLEANTGAARSSVLRFSCGNATSLFTLSQTAPATSFDAPQYCFYATFGTLPTLYAGLQLLSHDRPSWFLYERSQTFDPAAFPAYVTTLTAADRNSNLSPEEATEAADRIKERIRQINAEDPTSVFGLWVDDLRCRLGYDWFVAQGIDSARVKVTMLSDGSGTYNNFHTYFGDAATAETNWKTYASEVEALDWNHGGQYPVTRAPAAFNSPTWPYYLATRPDYRLVLQNAELLESSGAFITAQIDRMAIQSVQPYRLLEALPPTARETFYRMAGFDYERFTALFDASPKKNLVIIGTSHASPQSERQQAAYVQRIVEQWGEEYDLFFKPHPADSSAADYPERFPGLTLLPGQMPFEIFLWSLLDRIDRIGGYPSTVFLSVPLDKVGFLFARDAASLIRPLNLLFRDAAGIEWIE